MPSLYYYNSHLRWSFYWDNPNCWAALLVFVLVGAWAGQGSLRAAVYSLRFTVEVPTLGARCSPYFLIVVYALELGVCFLLVKTYSRGGLVAAIVALVLFFGLHGLRREKVAQTLLSVPFLKAVKAGTDKSVCATFTGWKPVLRSILIRLALVAVLCMAVGFASRVSPSYIAQDKSVLNRLDMWQGALVMMKDSPLVGWGNNNGGFSYINWYQPQSAAAHPVGFVNSFLDVGVEFGTPVLFVALGVGFWLMLVAVKVMGASSSCSGEQDAPLTLTASFVILAAWGVANIFTSLWRETALWIVPTGCAVYILMVCWRQGGASLTGRGCLQTARRGATRLANESHLDAQNTEGATSSRRAVWRPPLPVTLAFALSVGCVIVLLCAGWAFSGKYEWIARPSMGTDKITLIKRAKWGEHPASHPVGASLATPSNEKQTSNQGVASDAPTTEHGSRMLPLLFIDGAVFGRYFGKTFRDIAAKITWERFEVYPPWTQKFENPGSETQKIIYTGFQASWLAKRRALPSQEIVIFHPTVFPPTEAADIGASRVSLYMPSASASEYNLAWRRWAERNKIQIIKAPREALPL